MPPLPLLRLPQLALIEVLRCLDPIELFTLAQCSLKTSHLIPLSKSRKFIIDCESENEIKVNNQYTFLVKRYYEGERGFQSKYLDCTIKPYKGNLVTHWNDTSDGCLCLVVYLSNLFDCPINTLTFKAFGSDLERLATLKNEIRNFSFENFSSIKSENEMRTLLSLNITEKLSIDVLIYLNFGFTFQTFPKHLCLPRAYWFTLNNLLEAARSCISIELCYSRLKVTDLTEFLRQWKEGNFQSLKYLIVNNGVQMNGVGWCDPQNSAERVKTLERIGDNQQVSIKYGVQIERNDGKKAEYTLQDREFMFFVL